MDFYILKKNNQLTAIPAEESKCKEYLNSGYSYVNKVAACTETAAVEKQLSETNRFQPLLIAIVLLVIVFTAFYIVFSFK
ncbi:hypothetical protein CJF42_10545 [Pseudoalteromonas sp. NBT06-2]|uniref:hypothetical protein n=1 Tax=Pseudoalteromonas sp. NBT06-2 TaxID=2025950 RepID=UPI000BA63DB3|nr:hypothetical protein [Pseudoalteromonas sp. NBT06-2]PAJ74437.1 hypothetical protein CJF42_10545 [Pseudoalteromonas sp. NBT06-2]